MTIMRVGLVRADAGIRSLDRIIDRRDKPCTIWVDNGPESISTKADEMG